MKHSILSRSSRRMILVFLICLLGIAQANAQKDSTLKSVDSTLNTGMDAFRRNMAETEALQLADSLRRMALEEELRALKTTDNLSKVKLQAELEELSRRDSLRYANKKARIDSARGNTVGFPVEGFFNDTLFLMYQGLGSFSAGERANAASQRIHKLSTAFNFSKDSIHIEKAETTTNLLYGETIIIVITENDALWNNKNQDDLAIELKAVIESAVLKYKAETSLLEWLKKIGLTVLFFFIVFLIVKYTLRFFRWVDLKVVKQEGRKFSGVKIRNYTLFDARSQIRILRFAIKAVKWLVVAFLVYISLPFLFAIFPWTEGLTGTLLGYIIDPLKSIALALWNYFPDLITMLVIATVFRYIIKAVAYFKREIENGKLTLPGFYPDWANPTFQITRVILISFALVVIFPYIPGSDSPVFRGVSVFLGFLFTFGSAGSLSNIMAGVVLTYMRVYRIGDRVKLGDVTGDVIEKSLLVTRIRTIKNEIISVPNSSVMNSHTINYSSDAPEKGLIIHSTVTIGYDVPWKNMHDALIEAAGRTEFIEKEPSPFVLQTSLEDFYVAYQINAYTKAPNKQAVVYSNLHQHIQDVCNERGIEILSPHYRAARDGNMTTIPANYLDKDYVAPKFGVEWKGANSG